MNTLLLRTIHTSANESGSPERHRLEFLYRPMRLGAVQSKKNHERVCFPLSFELLLRAWLGHGCTCVEGQRGGGKVAHNLIDWLSAALEMAF